MFNKTNHPLSIISDIHLPKTNYGKVLIKLEYSGICHSQLMEIWGKRNEDKYLPHILGHEAISKVIQIGDRVTKVKVGEQVIQGWIKGEGLESNRKTYQTIDGEIINDGAVKPFLIMQ